MLKKFGKNLKNGLDICRGQIQQTWITGFSSTSSINQKSESDAQFDELMAWAERHTVEAQQLAMDSTRLLGCTGDRLQELQDQGFFKRCVRRLSGKTGEMERANMNDLISLQKNAFKYIDILQERQALQAQTMLVIKNNLNLLTNEVTNIRSDLNKAFDEIGKNRELINETINEVNKNREMIYKNRQYIIETAKATIENTRMIYKIGEQTQKNTQEIIETRIMVAELAKRINARFNNIESRTADLEISNSLQGWLLGLEERRYEDRYPPTIFRLLRVINDFYSIKNNNLNINDILFMKKAIRIIGLDPNMMWSLRDFIDNLVDEILLHDPEILQYSDLLDECAQYGITNYSEFVFKKISSPIFETLHTLKLKYIDRDNLIYQIQESINITRREALKKILFSDISKLNINLDTKLSIGDMAIEILTCMYLAEALFLDESHINNGLNTKKNELQQFSNNFTLYRGYNAISLIYETLDFLSRDNQDNKLKGYISNYNDKYYDQSSQVIPKFILTCGNLLNNKSLTKKEIIFCAYRDNKAYVRTTRNKFIVIDNNSKKCVYFDEISNMMFDIRDKVNNYPELVIVPSKNSNFIDAIKSDSLRDKFNKDKEILEKILQKEQIVMSKVFNELRNSISFSDKAIDMLSSAGKIAKRIVFGPERKRKN